MRDCGYEDLDLIPSGQMKLVVVKRNGTTEVAKRSSKSRGWWTNITICFGDFDLSICRDKAQNSADLLVESSIWEGKTPFEVPNGNSEFFNFFLYCHNCRPMAQNPNWGVENGD
ncbi:MAG: hypothetical protein V7K89_26990 [Nostoc sp.]|uniref:hypothetical protein n=1 Tax=Nostoc sp. TaxID=1180 RepID=UPI002FF969D9